MSVQNFDDLFRHRGHELALVTYGLPLSQPDNVAVECIECDEVIIDFDNPHKEEPS